MPPEVAVTADGEALAKLAAEFIVRLIAKCPREDFHMALAGGSTPTLLYRRLASKPILGEIPWRDLHLWWGDERAVGPESPYSNYRLVSETLLASAPIPADNVHRIEGELGAVRAAELYERELSQAMGTGRHFDLVLLGIGSDGHTASIFPGALAQVPEEGLVATTRGGDPAVDRITLTLRAINSAERVVMLAEGESKAKVVGRVLMGDASLPAARIKPRAGDGHLHIFLDRAAAAIFDTAGS